MQLEMANATINTRAVEAVNFFNACVNTLIMHHWYCWGNEFTGPEKDKQKKQSLEIDQIVPCNPNITTIYKSDEIATTIQLLEFTRLPNNHSLMEYSNCCFTEFSKLTYVH